MSLVIKLPLPFTLFILYVTLFFAITMLACIVIRERSLALFLSFLSWILLFEILPSAPFADYLSSFISSAWNNPSLGQSLCNLITGWSPNVILLIFFDNMNDSMGLSDCIIVNIPEFVKMFLYCAVVLYLTYLSFMRRDVA